MKEKNEISEKGPWDQKLDSGDHLLTGHLNPTNKE